MANNMRKFLKLSVDCVDMTTEQTRVNCGHDNLYSDKPSQYDKSVRRLVVLSDGTAQLHLIAMEKISLIYL